MIRSLVKQAGLSAKRSFSVFSVLRHKAAYEGEGKTTVRVLNQDPEMGLMIDSYATFGFKLNNGITVLGPMAIFPRMPKGYVTATQKLVKMNIFCGIEPLIVIHYCGTVLSWQVRGTHEVTPESLRLFKLLEPHIDLLILGLETKERDSINAVYRAAKSNNLNVELLSTEHACATFNFLNAEARCIAAALIPPLSITMNEDDMLESGLHYQNMYNRPDM